MRTYGLTSFLAVVALAYSAPCLAGDIKVNEELLIGWQGDTYKPELLFDPLHTRNLSDLPHELPLPASDSWIQQISWKPRAYIWHNFLTEQEARHVMSLATPQMKRSTVVGKGGQSVEDDYRTSYGTFLRRYQDAIIERIENKVAAWTQIPVSHQEDIQVLRYGIGQSYKVHQDSLRDNEAGIRVCTVLVYLNEPEEGGETAFPISEWLNPELRDKIGTGFSSCAKGYVGMKPKRGDALLFWNVHPDGDQEDYHASHTGCPVIKGVKWTMTKWIHARPFRPAEMVAVTGTKGIQVHHKDPGICEDVDPSCPRRAKAGECETNRDYMVVGVASAGNCRLSCGACKVCKPDDQECYNQNRRNVGFLVFDPSEINV